jgi:hypothetical protein
MIPAYCVFIELHAKPRQGRWECIAIAESKMLYGMANRMEAEASGTRDNFEDPFQRLEQTIRTCCSEARQEVAVELRTFVVLSHNIESITASLDNEI